LAQRRRLGVGAMSDVQTLQENLDIVGVARLSGEFLRKL
jgi:hypothetical protein